MTYKITQAQIRHLFYLNYKTNKLKIFAFEMKNAQMCQYTVECNQNNVLLPFAHEKNVGTKIHYLDNDAEENLANFLNLIYILLALGIKMNDTVYEFSFY